MIHYFFGLAAAPFTRAHQRIIEDILAENEQNKVYVAITEHDYKTITLPWNLRERIVEANLVEQIAAGRVVILKQTERTYRFLSSLHDWMDYVVVGEDEWNDLKAGKWHYSTELLNCWKWKVIPRATDSISSSKVRELLDKGCRRYDEFKELITRKTFDLLFSLAE